jgi:aspartyl-tRNA(Asn)/glutamyl-tRNA(Gln) amidotransferase subunit C
MTLDRARIESLATLARLDLSEAEKTQYLGDLGRIIAYVDQLRAVDTSGALAMAGLTDPTGRVRKDQPADMLPLSSVLANAPAKNDEAFLVPKVVER